MWILDLSTQPIEQPAIYLATNAQAVQTEGGVAPHKLGVCRAINGPVDIYPTSGAGTYTFHYLNQDFNVNPDGSERTDVSVRIIEQPKHGRLVQKYPEATDYTRNHYQYIPDVDYSDYDYFVMEAKTSVITVQIYYTMSVGLPGEPTYAIGENGERIDDVERCTKPYWKISQSSSITPIQFTYTLNLPVSFAGVGYTNPVITFSIIEGAAVGETQGKGVDATIVLDTNAAGHGWYIDYTPYLNEDFLTTINPNEWIAKARSAADGKMDLLSVLLHEYGHAMEPASMRTTSWAPR